MHLCTMRNMILLPGECLISFLGDSTVGVHTKTIRFESDDPLPKPYDLNWTNAVQRIFSQSESFRILVETMQG